MGDVLRIGILQLEGTASKEENLTKIRKLLSNADTDLIILPEYSMVPLPLIRKEELPKVAEPLDGSFVKELASMARERGASIIAGIYERADNGVYNTAVIISSDGDLVASYRKVHLYDAYGAKESDYFLKGGDSPPVVDIEGWRVSVAICFDLRFPELFRTAALRGAELFAVPAAWFRGDGKEEILHALARVRAHENVAWLALAVQYGAQFTGRSALIHPMGYVALDLGYGEKYVEAEISKKELGKAREILPLLKLRRPETYRGVCD